MSTGFNKEAFIKVEGNFTEKYDILKLLGEGGYARVLLVQNKKTKEFFACKELKKAKCKDLEALKKEIQIMQKTDHPNIIKLFEIYESDKILYLIMELCEGGELFDRIIQNTENGISFTESQAASLFEQMMTAINYCHKTKNIVHRDLKPENLLFLNKSDKSPLKVIDFGLSKLMDGEEMKERIGTAYYIAPEVLDGKYDEKCDIWSSGVILYILLCGYPCFNGCDDNAIFKSIKKGKVHFPSPEWDNISDEAKDLIKKMLVPQKNRLSAQEVLEHPWIKKNAPNSKNIQLPTKVDDLKKYSRKDKFRKAVLTFIASRLNEKEIKNIKETFQAVDTNKDGKLSLEEIKNIVLNNPDLKSENIDEIFAKIDNDNSGNIEYTEFISASLDKSIYLNEERLKEAFKSFDIDNSGKISKNEILSFIGSSSKNEAEEIIKKFDKNNDSEIDFQEFIEMMNQND